MAQTEGTFKASGGIDLYYQVWRNGEKPRAILAIVHGFGEHGGRYSRLVEHMIPNGYALYALDLRGHGRSPGQRGHITAWSEYREDVRAYMEMIWKNEPGIPVFIFGHSMGALIGLDYILHYPDRLQGAIISGAPIQPTGAASPALILVARVLSNLWPTFAMNLGLEVEAISRDPKVVQAYRSDPLVHGKTTPRWGTESLDTVAWVKTHAGELQVPLLMVHGGDDRLGAAAGSEWFCAQVRNPDKQVIVYPGSYHEVHNDLDSDRLMADLDAWLAKHLS